MNKGKRQSGIFNLGSVAVVLGGLTIGFFLIISGPKTSPEEENRPPKLVKTIRIQPATYRISVSAAGTVVPSRKVTIEPQVTGQIIHHHESLMPGGFLRDGEELFRIDPTLMELGLKESIAAVARAGAAHKEAQRKWSEAHELALEHVIPDTELAALESSVQIQLADLQRLSAGQSRTEELLKRHILRAPFNAMVVDEFVEIGQRVDPGFAAATLVGTDEFWVRASLPIDKLKWIKLPTATHTGAEVDVYLETGNGQPEHRRGRVVRLLGDMGQTGRMARVLISIENPLDLGLDSKGIPLLLGSYVRVEIDAGELKDVLAIERTALREQDRIWIVNSQSELQIRDVNVLWRTDEIVYIENVIRPGESLIISSLRVALPGMKVKAQLAKAADSENANVAEQS